MNARRYDILVCLFLVVAVALIYGRTLGHDFVNYDDPNYVVENAHVRAGLSLEGFRWALTTFHASNWHPLTWLSHMLDCQVFGLNPGRHHLVNLLLHLANAILMFLVFRTMTGSLWRSAFVAALFAVHPLHVDSVAWIAERKDVLSTLFWLLTMGAYARYARRPGARQYVLVMVLFALGLMAKPMPVTLPFVLLLMDVWPLGRWNRTAERCPEPHPSPVGLGPLILEKTPLLLLSALSSIVTIMAQQNAVSSLERLSLTTRMANALTSYAAYMGDMFWPSGLAAYYPYAAGPPAWKAAGAAVILAGLTLWFIKSFPRRPWLLVGWLWYIGTLVPVIGLIQVGAQSMADRYTYIPLTGLFIIVTWGAAEWAGARKSGDVILKVSAGVVLVLLIAGAYIQTGYWKDGLTLWRRAAAVTTDNAQANYNVANALVRQGDLEGAVRHYREALRIKPDFADALINLGAALNQMGQPGQAIPLLKKALAIKPGAAGAHTNLGLIDMAQGRLDEALRHFDEAVRLEPDSAGPHHNLGTLLWRLGSREKAIEHFQEGLRLNPTDANARNNLGNALWAVKRPEEAYQQYIETLRINPHHRQARKNLNNLRRVLGKE